MEDANNTQQQDMCCLSCKYFEERTCFCRYNPPTSMNVQAKNGTSYITAVYPKIGFPKFDYCFKFEMK